jgi:hypothetical protein
MSFAPVAPSNLIVWRPGSGQSGPVIFDTFEQAAQAAAATEAIVEIQFDGSILGTDLVLPPGVFDLRGAILSGVAVTVTGLNPVTFQPYNVIANAGTTLLNVSGVRDGFFGVNDQGSQPLFILNSSAGVWIQERAALRSISGPCLECGALSIIFLGESADLSNEGARVVRLSQIPSELSVSVNTDANLSDDAFDAPDPTQLVEVSQNSITSSVGLTQSDTPGFSLYPRGDLSTVEFNGPFAFASSINNLNDAWNLLVTQVRSIINRNIDGLGSPDPISLAFPADNGSSLETERAYFVNTISASGTLNLPAASASRGRIYVINSAGANQVTVFATGLDSINGSPSSIINSSESLTLISDGNSFWGIF